MLPIKNILTQNRVFLVIFVVIILLIVAFFVITNYDKKVYEDPLSESNFPSIKVMVQNGCGFTGVAQNVRNALSEKNIDVVRVGNARQFVYEETIIVVKHDDEIDLQRLINMTGIENVIYAVDKDFTVPFIIVAGRDYQKYF